MRASDAAIQLVVAQPRFGATLTNTPAWLGESVHLKGRLTVGIGSSCERTGIGQRNL